MLGTRRVGSGRHSYFCNASLSRQEPRHPSRIPSIEAVAISEAGDIDLSGLQYLHGLRYLTLSNYKSPVRLSQFASLKFFAGDWSPKLDLGPNCSALETLHLWKYQSNSKNLISFPEIPSLRELQLIQPKILSLDGIERFTQLKALEFHSAGSLESLDAVKGFKTSSLESLVFSKCKKLRDYSPLSALTQLRFLGLNGCSEIPTLRFVLACRSLERLGIVETNVVDGDLDLLLQHPRLEYVGTFDKRHYSTKEVDLNAKLALNAKNPPVS